MLSFTSMEEEAYYLKIEALWLLTNLAYCEEIDAMKILAGVGSGDMDLEDLKDEMKYNKSAILESISQLLR